MKRAVFEVVVGGTNITTALSPVFTSLSITDNAGTHGDTANIDVDDSGGKIVFPKVKAPVVISIGWFGSPLREVFRGTVDEVRSAGSRSGGRTLSISAKGFDTTGKVKEGQQRHFDDQTVEAILKEAGTSAGIEEVDVDPNLRGIVIPYLEMRGESLLHLGERLAREIGGSFRIAGKKVTLSKRAGGYTPTVTAAYGINLHSWDCTPVVGRAAHKKTRAKAYDAKKGEEVEVSSADTGVEFSDAEFVRRELLADKDTAQRAADGDAANAKEKAGFGNVVIEGTTDAVPDGLCVLTGARAGVDGTYRIKSVTHDLSRSGGWVTRLELAEPQGEAGKDGRGSPAAAAETPAASGPVTGPQ